MDLAIDACHICIGAVYMPPRGGNRISVFESIGTVHKNTPTDHRIFFGGDWNSHMGRDGVDGRQAMLQATSAGGKQMQKYLATKFRDKLLVADQKLVIRKRGT